MDVVGRFWERVTAPVPELSTAVLLGAAVVAALLVLSPALWRTTRHAVTIAHEGAHGVTALLSGRRLQGIRLHSDTSGLTVSAGRPTGPGMVLTLLAGYPAASLFGLLGAVVLTTGRITLMLAVALAALPLMLIMIRNFFGVLTVVV